MTDVLRIEADGPVRRVTLNRPLVGNAMDAALHRAIVEIWDELDADETVRCVVLTGAGNAFCAGGDLTWISSFEHDHVARDGSLVDGQRLVEALLGFSKPVIAAVNGPAVGLGCSIALLCDIVLVADTASFADPHVAIGLVAGDGGAAFWPLLTPLQRSREYLFTGDPIEASLAVELGLATRVVPAALLLDEADSLAHRLARRPAEALSGTKAILNRHLRRAVEDGTLAAGFAAERASMESADHLAKVAAMRRQGTQD